MHQREVSESSESVISRSVVVYSSGSFDQDNKSRVMNTLARRPHNSTSCRAIQAREMQQTCRATQRLSSKMHLPSKQKQHSLATATLLSSNTPGWQSGPSAFLTHRFSFEMVCVKLGKKAKQQAPPRRLPSPHLPQAQLTCFVARVYQAMQTLVAQCSHWTSSR